MQKLGDVINALPIARHIFLSTGQKPDWYISLHHASLFSGVTYCTPIKIQFDPNRVDLALTEAKREHQTVLMLQTFGRLWRGRRDMSYNKVAWYEAGIGEQFSDLESHPLVFDRRDTERESRLCLKHLRDTKPVMLLSLSCGKSSPFSAHHAFSTSIIRQWGNQFQIVDLCKVRGARIYDCLGLMDRATLLITSDSCFVHLAAASPNLPVVFLSNNNSFMASDPRCRCMLRLKYEEWHSRIKEVHHAIASTFESLTPNSP